MNKYIVSNPEIVRFVPTHNWEVRLMNIKKFIKSPFDLGDSLDSIFKQVCHKANLSIDVVKSKTRKRSIVEARQIYFKRAREITKKSLWEIGAYLNKDHSTVLHGIKTINSVPELKNRYDKYFPKPNQIITEAKIFSIPVGPLQKIVKVQSPFMELESSNNKPYSGYRTHQL
jgi:hypothetical protein